MRRNGAECFPCGRPEGQLLNRLTNHKCVWHVHNYSRNTDRQTHRDVDITSACGLQRGGGVTLTKPHLYKTMTKLLVSLQDGDHPKKKNEGSSQMVTRILYGQRLWLTRLTGRGMPSGQKWELALWNMELLEWSSNQANEPTGVSALMMNVRDQQHRKRLSDCHCRCACRCTIKPATLVNESTLQVVEGISGHASAPSSH